MEGYSLLSVRYHTHFAYTDNVVCTYGAKVGDKKYTYLYKYTYCPKTKEWSYEASRFSKKSAGVDKVTGMTESQLVDFLKEEFKEKFDARAVFYEKVADLLNNKNMNIAITKVWEFAWGKTRLALRMVDVETNMALLFLFGEGGNLNEVKVQETSESKEEGTARFLDSFPESIEKIRRYLFEESEYRMKLLML